MISIRPAIRADASAIAHVHIASWRSTYAGLVPEAYLAALNEEDRTEQWRHWLTLDVVILVAELDDAIVGFAGAGPVREPFRDYDAELYTLYLLERVQRRGIGTRLLAASAEALHTRGFRSMLAWVLAGNSSRAFYERTGGVPLTEKQTEIGDVSLPVIAFGWSELPMSASIAPR